MPIVVLEMQRIKIFLADALSSFLVKYFFIVHFSYYCFTLVSVIK